MKKIKVNPEVEVLRNQLARALADYDNLRKRTEEEKIGWIKFATERLIQDLLPIVDNLDMTIMSAKESGQDSAWLRGVEVADGELRKILQKQGLEQVLADNFDPELHEAVELKDGPKGKILKVLQMGYKLNGQLIRAARVVVGNGA